MQVLVCSQDRKSLTRKFNTRLVRAKKVDRLICLWSLNSLCINYVLIMLTFLLQFILNAYEDFINIFVVHEAN